MSNPYSRGPSLGGGAFGSGPVAKDLVGLLLVLFVTFSLSQLGMGLLMAWLRLSPATWPVGLLWQPATYGFVGTGAPSLWFLLELLILFWFGRDVRNALGKKKFWRLLILATLAAGLLAVATYFVSSLVGFSPVRPFLILQGQRVLLTTTIAAFAAMRPNATILLFFVLPIQAKWFIPLELLFAFMAFLASGPGLFGKDLPGVVGLFVAVGATLWLLGRRSGGRRSGGGMFKEARLRIEKWLIQRKLKRMRKKNNIRAVN